MKFQYFLLCSIFLFLGSTAFAGIHQVEQFEYQYQIEMPTVWQDIMDREKADSPKDISLKYKSKNIILLTFSKPDGFGGTVEDLAEQISQYYQSKKANCQQEILEPISIGSYGSSTPILLSVTHLRGSSLFQIIGILRVNGSSYKVMATFEKAEDQALALAGFQQSLESFRLTSSRF